MTIPHSITVEIWERVVMCLLHRMGYDEVTVRASDIEKLFKKYGEPPALLCTLQKIDGEQCVTLNLQSESEAVAILEKAKNEKGVVVEPRGKFSGTEFEN